MRYGGPAASKEVGMLNTGSSRVPRQSSRADFPSLNIAGVIRLTCKAEDFFFSWTYLGMPPWGFMKTLNRPLSQSTFLETGTRKQNRSPFH